MKTLTIISIVVEGIGLLVGIVRLVLMIRIRKKKENRR